MFESVSALEDHLATPSEGLIADLALGRGDLVILGAGGKMGPSLARLARRGLDAAGRGRDRVFAVSRWSDLAQRSALEAHDVVPIAFDLLAEDNLTALPDAGAVVFMVGAKFGTSETPWLAWAVNTALPARVARRYADAQLAVFSTGNVYPLVPTGSGGCREEDPVAPAGEYAMSCLGRERLFEQAAAAYGTPVSILRLNYAIDLRYGVLADLAALILDGEPVDLRVGAVNVVWQGYANEVALRSLAHASAPPLVVNLTGPETASVRSLATDLAAALGRRAEFAGEPEPTALLSNASRCHGRYGYPAVTLDAMVDWQAQWLAAGLPTSGKPTKFAVRDGRF